MRITVRPVACLIALAAFAGCSPKRIPGTQIDDTPDTRAVVAVIDAYRHAAERRDADAVMALVSSKYFDDGGTPDPGDDVDYDQLRQRLVGDYAKLVAVRLEIDVRGIDVTEGKADAYVFYDERFRIRTRTGEVPKQASDVHRMRFVREDGAWKFVSGL